MTITAYVYEASLHCPEHAKQRFGDALDNPDTTDNEGNPIGAVYSYDLTADDYCDECLFECVTNKWPGSYARFA